MEPIGESVQGSRALDAESALEARDSAVEDRAGVTAWPVVTASTGTPLPPPVGLNWGTVSQALGIDLRVLLHEGQIVVEGDNFTEAGYFLDPASVRAHFVDVGDRALRPGYFLPDLSVSEFRVELPVESGTTSTDMPIVRAASGAVTGLFAERALAERARSRIVRGSLGGGITVDEGPLGIELKVRETSSPGMIATIIASHSGAVVAIGGRPLGEAVPVSGPGTTARRTASGAVDVRRAGKGASTST